MNRLVPFPAPAALAALAAALAAALLAVASPALAHGGDWEREGSMTRFPADAGGFGISARLDEGDVDWARIPSDGGLILVRVTVGERESVPAVLLVGPGEGAVLLAAEGEPMPVCGFRVCVEEHRFAWDATEAGAFHVALWSPDGSAMSFTLQVGEGDVHGEGLRFLREPAPGEPASAVADSESAPTPWWMWVGRAIVPVGLAGGVAVVVVVEIRARRRARAKARDGKGP